MLIPSNVGQTHSSSAAGSHGSKAQTDNTELNQDFGNLLNAKVGGSTRNASTSAGDAKASSASADSPSKTVVDDAAQGQDDDHLTANVTPDTEAAIATPPTPTDGGKTGVKTATPSADDTEPALDTSAAQALMALLAQTQPTLASNRATGTRADGATTAGDKNQLAGVYAANGDQRQVANTDATTGDQSLNAADKALTATANAAGTLVDQAALLSTIKAQGSDKTTTSTLASTAPAGKTLKSGVSTESDQHHKAADSNDSARAAAAVQGLTAVIRQDAGEAQDATTFSFGSGATVLDKKTAGNVDATTAPTSPIATPTLSAAGSAANATPAPAAALISAQLGSDEWQQAISQQVVMFSRNGQQSAELRLHPDNLGALHISLQVDNNQAQIHLASGHSHVRAALEAALPHLRTALADSGITLGQSSVGSDATPNWSGNDGSANNQSSGQRAFTMTHTVTAADNVTSVASASRSLSGIDTFV
ncbi:flagellar hook-length control protein FliK [Acerihabitans sp. TG2]|uniref:flagellar hook-length control protein FliK n=1 Tax=Acerihabitans sp. TG2 TaxID=3096008 RepID=UPI002B22F5D9|nr:flagellar hook-length control protein FliK [Acerihabitans sp. TG2]MEA9392589.1 flagellar hook-length control protein FliK [Acerihabitans sp. TG2]